MAGTKYHTKAHSHTHARAHSRNTQTVRLGLSVLPAWQRESPESRHCTCAHAFSASGGAWGGKRQGAPQCSGTPRVGVLVVTNMFLLKGFTVKEPCW